MRDISVIFARIEAGLPVSDEERQAAVSWMEEMKRKQRRAGRVTDALIILSALTILWAVFASG